jgi:hypothetical protein
MIKKPYFAKKKHSSQIYSINSWKNYFKPIPLSLSKLNQSKKLISQNSFNI